MTLIAICGLIYLLSIIWNITVTLFLIHIDFICEEDVTNIVFFLAIFPITAPLYTFTITVGLFSFLINSMFDKIIKLFNKK